MQIEIDSFIEAQNTVCQISKLNINVFMNTNTTLPSDKKAIHDLLNISLTSPFKSQRAFSRERAIEIFKACSNYALDKVQEQSVIDQLTDKDEVLIIFDTLLVDYAMIHFGINCEEFKATVSKYDLLNDRELKPQVTAIVDKISELHEKMDELE